jgi:hypothetical protein
MVRSVSSARVPDPGIDDRFRDGSGVVGGPVVDEDDLQPVVAGEKRADSVGDAFVFVVGRHDHRDRLGDRGPQEKAGSLRRRWWRRATNPISASRSRIRIPMISNSHCSTLMKPRAPATLAVSDASLDRQSGGAAHAGSTAAAVKIENLAVRRVGASM